MGKFEGKRVLVTGASGGIGAAITEAFRREGAMVAAADLDGRHAIEADIWLAGNLSDGTYADSLPEQTAAALGGLDIIANNAGFMSRGAVTDTSDADLAMSMAVNVEAPFRISRAAIPIMAAAGGGVIVNTASCWGLRPGPAHAVYCMTKAALASLTQCMGMDHAPQGIRINAVCPNEVDTPMLRTGFERRGLDPATAVETLGATVPVGHVASPEEIADVVLFLASDDARYMCGALVEVNGGKPVS